MADTGVVGAVAFADGPAGARRSDRDCRAGGAAGGSGAGMPTWPRVCRRRWAWSARGFSMTKVVTATPAMWLADRGLLGLDRPVLRLTALRGTRTTRRHHRVTAQSPEGSSMRHRHLSRQARAPTGARAQSGSTPPTARPARPPPYPLGPAGHARVGPGTPVSTVVTLSAAALERYAGRS
jgi:hypothetical protein